MAGKAETNHKKNLPSELLAALRQGDTYAYKLVYCRYYQLVMRFLRALTPSADDAEEVCQEVFIKLWLHRRAIDPKRDLTAYLYTIVRHELADFYRARRRIKCFSQPELWDDREAAHPDQWLIADETYNRIAAIVNNMPKRRKQCFRMSRVDGWSNEAIATALGITKNAVAKHLTFALRDIRKALKKEC